ncbi:MAG: hypothetical protein CBC29_06010 [Methylococcaceae bacterium TMED69]|nr:MAG: hypothetical protein CBC29_06010 [Methylococcaceae bacterium TMED69]|tara:strand:+ start:1877 stop:2134 length:258 start_codon:yes stop_codon:yes gene_type:complete
MKKTKSEKSDVEEKIDEICIVEIEEEYRVLWESDDGGNHIVVAFEKNCPPMAKKLLKSPFMGWRLIIKICPEGYLKVFHPLNKKK